MGLSTSSTHCVLITLQQGQTQYTEQLELNIKGPGVIILFKQSCKVNFVLDKFNFP